MYIDDNVKEIIKNNLSKLVWNIDFHFDYHKEDFNVICSSMMDVKSFYALFDNMNNPLNINKENGLNMKFNLNDVLTILIVNYEILDKRRVFFDITSFSDKNVSYILNSILDIIPISNIDSINDKNIETVIKDLEKSISEYKKIINRVKDLK